MLLRRLLLPTFPSPRFFTTKTNTDLRSTIAELNKEMEMIFGEPPSSGFGTTPSDNSEAGEINHDPSPASRANAISLTHVGTAGEAQMVDVSTKATSKRTAIASCKVILGKKVFGLVSANQLAKGDVLSVAKIAGINGAKSTSSLIPLCHNIMLTHVRVDLELDPKDFSVCIEGEASSTGQTGVEMEAMTAVSIAGLTVYDMCKAASKDIRITNVQLESKTGGKSGDWFREK